MPTDDSNPFRDFALSVYGNPAVEGACLDLQKGFEADVLIVLMCAWLGRYGVRLSEEGLAEVDRVAAPWRDDVIAPIRAIRTRMKLPVGEVQMDQASGVRETLKSAELAAEMLQIDVLYGLMETLTGRDGRDADRAGLIRGNILRYLAMKGVAADKVPRETIESLVNFCSEAKVG
ncbi:MAG: TIGR02444 family protein [Alphaproteobacteria bacterium]